MKVVAAMLLLSTTVTTQRVGELNPSSLTEQNNPVTDKHDESSRTTAAISSGCIPREPK
jgi:hypothetical protein